MANHPSNFSQSHTTSLKLLNTLYLELPFAQTQVSYTERLYHRRISLWHNHYDAPAHKWMPRPQYLIVTKCLQFRRAPVVILGQKGLMGIWPTQAPKWMPPDMHAKQTASRTNLWNQLFTVDDNKHLTVKWLEPPEDQALQPTTMRVHNSDDLMLCVTDWEGKVAKKKPSAKDGSVPSEQGGTLGDPNPDDGADGTTRPNPKRRRKNEVTDGSGTRRGAKRKKVVSNPIIEDEDEGPQATSTHSIGPALSSTSTPPSPLPMFGVGTMGPNG
ncbi:hypothetical protein BS47DRAFT_1365997 [Hydnum rufescens UP504]|uniref:Uncharacterized protein n=1 Tax=Hydnum rufescens UP504 TaxID=1448309 RepID=A0A9P6AM49_9AGAM|nr:hypothetical protein BS47DRAFT_1365997 [Hydnum rufescens UP504]